MADSNTDGIITGLELASHLLSVVPKVSPKQTPRIGYFSGEGEFLFLRPEADWESVMKRAVAPGMLTLKVHPPRYYSRIDDRSVASPVLGHELYPGQHTVEVGARGYKRWRGVVEITPEDTYKEDIRLIPRSRLGAALKSTLIHGLGDWYVFEVRGRYKPTIPKHVEKHRGSAVQRRLLLLHSTRGL